MTSTNCQVAECHYSIVGGLTVGRIVFFQGEYYEEPLRGASLRNGQALFQAQLMHDLQAAEKHHYKTTKELPSRIAKSLAFGIVSTAITAFFLWLIVSVIHWFWLHPLW
jgi:hypothetical protein